MESATIKGQKNISLDSGATFLHPCDYCYQLYITCNVSCVKSQMSGFKLGELVGGGSFNDGATLSSLIHYSSKQLLNLLE